SSRSSAVPVQFFRNPLDPLGCELPGHLVVAVWSPERLVLHVTPIDGVFLGTRSDLVHPAPRPEKAAEPSLRNAERPSGHPKTHTAVGINGLLRALGLGVRLLQLGRLGYCDLLGDLPLTLGL